MSNGLIDPSLSSTMMERTAQHNLMMQGGMMAPSPQSLQMVPNSSSHNQMQPQSPMNLNMMNNMNMNFNGTEVTLILRLIYLLSIY